MRAAASLSEQVFTEVRERIVRGHFLRGSAIRQDALAAELGVSKIPVREALVRLQTEGLLVLSPNRGFTVRQLSLDEAEEVFQLRIRLEPEAAALGARHATAADHRHGRSLLASLDAAMDAGDHPRVSEFNRAFHRALIKPCGRPITLEFLERLLNQFCLQVGTVSRFDEAKREHKGLLAAWSGRDEAAVIQITRGHLEYTLEQLRLDKASALS
jgi:DNA-binding GntR family transcriptional regulator